MRFCWCAAFQTEYPVWHGAQLFYMKSTLKSILFALSFACLSSHVSAMSLGEGQMVSRVGEPFSANISLLGTYDKNVRFYQVKSGECRSSLIGSTASGCDSVYEKRLTFFIKKKPDGQYFLRIDGERSEDFFYRIIIKYRSPSSGPVYKTFDFLPEFKNSSDTPTETSNGDDVTVSASVPSGKFGVIMGNVVEIPGDIEDKSVPHEAVNASPHKSKNPSAEVSTTDVKKVKHTKPQRDKPDVSAKRVSKAKRQTSKAAVPELLIKKEGSYADEIIALQKENDTIVQQIAMLEKQIAMLKALDKLKTQTGVSSAPAVALKMTPATNVPESSPVAVSSPVASPVKIPGKTVKPADAGGSSVLRWILIAVILLLLGLLLFLYRRQKNMLHEYNLAEFKSSMVSPASSDDSKYLDLINEFPRK